MKISRLKKSYEGFSLDVEQLSIEPGRIYGLIGPNGCGKSTLMKLIAGTLQPDSGSIDHEGLGPRDITLLAREPYLLHDTVLNNLLYPLRLRGIKPEEAELDYWLSLAGLESMGNKYAPGLSGGERQKLALIRALIFSPRLILLDEGMSNMDIESIARFEALIRERQEKDPVTWLIVSHQLSHIGRLCREVVFMEAGKIRTRGPAERILFEPDDPALTRYLSFEAIRRGQ
jgi:tungstate transport system ATP-binding protein